MLDHEEQDPAADLVTHVVSPGQETAAEVGSELRDARLRLGWNLPDIAAALRIRHSYLEALEQGHVSELPGIAYALGFLRTYAAALGLDSAALAHRFKSAASDAVRTPELSFPTPVPKRGFPASAAALLGLVLVVGAYVGWYRLSGEGKLPPEVVPALPQRLATLAEQAIRIPSPASPAASPPSATQPATPDRPASQPASTGPAEPGLGPGSGTAAPIPTSASGDAAETPLPSSAGSEEWRLVLRATADAWMQVRARSGQILLSRTLHPGEVWPVPPEPDLLLTTGNAGGTELVVDGVAAPPIGNPGAIRRDLPLDPDAIRDGKLPAQIKAASAAQPSGARPASPQ